MNRLIKKIIITGTMEALTGIRVGGNKDTVEIGGIDNPVIRCVLKDRQPYIPGSSIKGKLRSLLQQAIGEADEKQTHSIVCQLFGAAENSIKEDDKTRKIDGSISRLIVRDAYLKEDSAKELKESEYTDMPYTEAKWENRIDRIKGVAEHPRQQERVPAGAIFDLEFVINVFENDDEHKLISTLQKGIELLSNDYLGGSGTRGYGKVKLDIDWKGKQEVDVQQLIKQNAAV